MTVRFSASSRQPPSRCFIIESHTCFSGVTTQDSQQSLLTGDSDWEATLKKISGPAMHLELLCYHVHAFEEKNSLLERILQLCTWEHMQWSIYTGRHASNASFNFERKQIGFLTYMSNNAIHCSLAVHILIASPYVIFLLYNLSLLRLGSDRTDGPTGRTMVIEDTKPVSLLCLTTKPGLEGNSG
ncbi:hypothetical protein B0H11DRAFT_1900133 [Mycena galericulata]|nr:hypothetical protein B0H11DRAFT_1900133 [Mycena galericulata]